MMKIERRESQSIRETMSPALARWLTGLLLIVACVFVVLHFYGSLFTQGIDLSLHYALVARIWERGNLPIQDDPSLGELNFYPRYSHRIAAIVGSALGSPLVGMQLVAVLALAVLWSGFGFMFFSLPRRLLWWASGGVAALLLANRLWIHLELFGNELIVNYYYPQLVAQAGAIGGLAIALWLERTRLSPRVSYLVLAGLAPILAQFHSLPAVEVLAAGVLLVVVDAFATRAQNQRARLIFGASILLVSLVVTVHSPGFMTMMRLSENNGYLILRYIPDLPALAVECGLVLVLSAVLVWCWMRIEAPEARLHALALKYVGVFGMAAACLCLLQVLALRLGYGSEYACRKYAFALSTSLLLDVPLLVAAFVPKLVTRFVGNEKEAAGLMATLLQRSFVGVFVLVACFAILPATPDRVAAVSDIVRAEGFALQYRRALGSDAASKYDYAIGITGQNTGYDYLITIGMLRTPRWGDAEDLLFGRPLSQPRKMGRIFTRLGSVPWDVPTCRQLTTPEGFAILDGQCVLMQLGGKKS